MTGFGIYIVVYLVLNILASVYYAGKGGCEYTPGVLVFAACWSAVNLLGVVLIGTGLGL